ncbi:MAG: DNA primase [Actinomycetota bacterium]
MAGGRIRDEDIERLREQVDIVEVISEYVQLKKAGRLFKGLCPFHDEKTPSFMVDPAKQLYHCFGCGEGGDVFTFLRRREGLEFREAVERLASRVGFNLHYQGRAREPGGAESRRERLYRVNQWAAEIYHRVLVEGGEGEAARKYLESRGIDMDSVRRFTLGYAPPRWDFLYRQAVRKGFDAQDVLTSGLGLRGEKGVYDRFRGRIIFPIRDIQGRVVAFGGRSLGDEQPKYLNSPETPIYVKSRHLYALDLSRREMVKEGYAILVEGYTDVILLWQHGIRNVAATLGTALGQDHFRLLSRLTERVVLAFDADRAGISASLRGLDLQQDFNLDLRVIALDEGADPADFVSSRGAEEFLRRVDESVPLLDFSLRRVLEEHDPSDANSRLRGVRKAISLVAELGGGLEQERHIRTIADWAGSSYQAVQELYRRARGRDTGPAPAGEASILDPPWKRAERELLRLLLHQPFLVERAAEEVDPTLIEDRDCSLVLSSLLKLYREGGREAVLDERRLGRLVENLDSDSARNLATALILDGSGNVDHVRTESAEIMYNSLLATLKEFYLERQIRRLKQELEDLSSAPRRDHERERELSEEIYSLERLKRELRRGRAG